MPKFSKHAANRAWERYNFDLSFKRQRRIIKMIKRQDKRVVLRRKQENGSGVYLVEVQERHLVIVYDYKKKYIKTCLPM